MSEYPAINTILGIIGTVTGTSALIISYLTYRKQRPNLKIEVAKCEHKFTTSKSKVKSIQLWADFKIRNLGDRATRITDVGIRFKANGMKYQFKKELSMDPKEDNIWLQAHDTFEFTGYFSNIFKSKEQEKLDCTCTIFHTHGAVDVKFKSKIKSEPENRK